VISLCDQYPYSQLLHALAARVSKDHNLQNQQAILQSAAVYSTDRSVLKEIMSASAMATTGQETVAGTTTVSSITITAEKDSIDYAEAVLKDLKRLHELKHNFEEAVTAFENGIPVVPEKQAIRKPVGRPKKVVEVKSDPFIEEIKTTKKKIAPENEKTKEQIEIIDQFIKAQPSITARPRSEMATAGDLTEVKNGEFADNVISETLVEILIRQGKKEKAIEVLKKLIWKFPQKKTYFAAQIEDLKK
jgi:tetratricopeptide (TPR) repeat protein